MKGEKEARKDRRIDKLEEKITLVKIIQRDIKEG